MDPLVPRAEPTPVPVREGPAVRVIDRVSEITGQAVLWLVGVMVFVGAFNAVARYVTRWTGANLSSNAYIEAQWYLFSIVFLLGAAYALKHDAHVRVDVFYGRLSPRGKAWVDLLGTVLFLVPFCIFMLIVSWPSVAASWRVREVSPDPGGLPRYPIKAVILLAFALLLAQGVAEALKRVRVLRGEAAVPRAEPDPRSGA
ncbi:MAG: TRAP transporter small permease subunit [Gemmatimonadetes bacterium]|nr:TRAP transporter small permease subunit [Gemmatimonadota bacterium]